MKQTEEDRAVLDSWPVVSKSDIEALNDLFPHYIFFRARKYAAEFHASCCGHRQTISHLRRTEFPWENSLLNACRHDQPHTCPWCGHKVVMKDLSRAGKRKKLKAYELVLLLHARDGALYADALCLRKEYETEEALTERPQYWLNSGYRFALGDVMEIDYQTFSGEGVVTHERGRLGRKKLVQEPFKSGSLSWYSHGPYAIVNRDALAACPDLRYCQYFSGWQYRPGGARGYAFRFCDFVSYLTAYCMYPRPIEMLVKAGLYEPVAGLVHDRKKFAGAIRWEEPDIRTSMDLDKRELSQLISLHPPMEALVCRAKAKRLFGLAWDVADALDFYQCFGSQADGMEVLRFCREYKLDPERLLRYMESQMVVDADLPWLDMADVFELYRDYLDAAYYLGRCLEHGKVLWPDDLRQAHDLMTGQWAVSQTELAEQRGRAPESANIRRLKYEFELDGLRIVFPMTAASIRREGKLLKHCVGGYADRHMKGVLTILFLRRAAAPGTPYVTIEMRGNQIEQIHGYQNDLHGESPGKTHREFINAWLGWLKKGSRRDKDGRPILPGKRKGAAA